YAGGLHEQPTAVCYPFVGGSGATPRGIRCPAQRGASQLCVLAESFAGAAVHAGSAQLPSQAGGNRGDSRTERLRQIHFAEAHFGGAAANVRQDFSERI